MPPSEIPKRVMPMLGRAYAALADAKMTHDGQNVFVYRDAGGGLVDVETGVGVDGPFAPTETLAARRDAGRARRHDDALGRLRTAHVERAQGDSRVVLRAFARKLAGASWEVYGHWSDDPAAVRTDVFYLVAARDRREFSRATG